MHSSTSIKIDSLVAFLAVASAASAQAVWGGYANPQAAANNMWLANANMHIPQPHMRGKMFAANGGGYSAYESVEPSSESTSEYSSAVYSADAYTSEEVEPSSEIPQPSYYSSYQGVEPTETQTCPIVEPTTITITETTIVTQPAPPAVTVTCTETVTVNNVSTVTTTVTQEVAPSYATSPAYSHSAYESSQAYVAPTYVAPTYAAPTYAAPTYAAPSPPPSYSSVAPAAYQATAPADYEAYQAPVPKKYAHNSSKHSNAQGGDLYNNQWMKPVPAEMAPGTTWWINMRNAKTGNSEANKDVGLNMKNNIIHRNA
ncbi:hypothetical protein GGI25_005830 [Coemansia spiralis]|uniref:Uncharacterized protein n=2 Tax=Coemansia TaxID=4863 RepID=A0A9W8G1J5_9FUNG|nr:hypothetical protein EDC05_005885 [Coemansia umbellata]KAJ2619249.1 hypothetical protein GGI26_005990 [Coemansia sp. RSA 1358]KAJ2670474.1 hypothetical protein GGI25_005830 [Coemansia spiralis]